MYDLTTSLPSISHLTQRLPPIGKFAKVILVCFYNFMRKYFRLIIQFPKLNPRAKQYPVPIRSYIRAMPHPIQYRSIGSLVDIIQYYVRE